MSISTLPIGTRTVTYTATAAQTAFPVPFPFYAAADLTVRRYRASVEAVLVLGTDYTVTGAGLQAGGTVTLAAGATAADVYVVEGNRPIGRTTAYITGGRLTADAMNADLNQLVIHQQELERDQALALQLPLADRGASATLPRAADRANRALGFDGAGAPVMVPAATGPLLDLGLTMTGPALLGRAGSGAGAVAAVTMGTGMVLNGGTLSATGAGVGGGALAASGFQVTQSRLIGRAPGSDGQPQEISLGAGLSWGAGATITGYQPSGALTASGFTVSTGSRLIGRVTGAGAPEELTIGTGLEVVGSAVRVVRGDLPSAGYTMTGPALLGRSGSGAGAVAAVTMGTGMVLNGGTLSATGAGVGGGALAASGFQVTQSRLIGRAPGTDGQPQEISLGAGLSWGAGATITGYQPSGALTASGFTVSTGSRLIGRVTGAGAPEELTIGTGLELTGTTLRVTANEGFVPSGPITSTGYTVEGPALLGRAAAGTGALARLTLGAGLVFEAGALRTGNTLAAAGFTTTAGSRLMGRGSVRTDGLVGELTVGTGLAFVGDELRLSDHTHALANVTGLEQALADATAGIAAAEAAAIAELDQRAEIYDTRAYDYTHGFVAPDADGRDQVLGGIRPDGTLDFARATLPSVTAATIALGTRTLFEYETLIPGDILVLDADDRIVQVIAGASAYPQDDVRFYQPTIDLTGTLDESAKLKAAHDAAATAGIRDLFIEGPIRAPTALFLGDVFLRSRSGKGRLIGTYRKQVVPSSAFSPALRSGILPAAHLRRTRAKLTTATPTDPVIWVIVSDSWGNPNQLIAETSQFQESLQREIWRQFGPDGSKIRLVNRAIGGTTVNDFASPNPYVGTLPNWYTNSSLRWMNYVTSVQQSDLTPAARTPDAWFLMFGMNHSAVDVSTIQAWRDVLTELEAVTPAADIVYVAGTTPSTMSTLRGTQAAQEARLSFASLVRSMADKQGRGLIDLGRAFDLAHWGLDPTAVSFEQIGTSQAVTLPYSWPQATQDFGVVLTGAGLGPSFWSTGNGVLTIALSSIPGNAVLLERDAGTGNIAVTVNAATGIPSIPRIVSAVQANGGAGSDANLTLAVKGSHLLIDWRGSRVFNAPIERASILFTPSVAFGGGATLALTATRLSVSVNRPAVPFLTDTEAWGGASGSIGGNDENHLAEPGREAVFDRALAATTFN